MAQRDGEDELTWSRHYRRRLPHHQAAWCTYVLTSSVRPGRTETLIEPAIAEIVATALAHDDGRRYDLHAYVLMPDHFHALLAPLNRGEGSVPFSEIVQALKGVTGHRINALTGRRGPFWVEDYFERIVRNESHYRSAMHYIRCNPLNAGLAERPEDWPWLWIRPGL